MSGSLRLSVIVPFRDEAEHLPALLTSIEAQRRPPDELLLIDDGSTDGSAECAARFAAAHSYARFERRPARGPQRNRLADAQALRAFLWGLERAGIQWDVIAKVDADVCLSVNLFAEIEWRFAADSRLGMAGAYLSQVGPDGTLRRQRCPADHVEGPTRFYRRACLEQISPIPAIVGWDTIDETRARMRGWRTRAIELPTGDPVHLRRMGSREGVLRGYRRAGRAAYAYGSDPVYLLAAAAVRLRDRPVVACGAAYLAGYVAAAVMRAPRAEPGARAYQRRAQRVRLAARLGGRTA
jgi:biofilm PGA synthesis N-glycosyltransferase PgaC